MGQKVNPISLRTGVYKGWDSRWFPRRSGDYASNFFEDIAIRDYLKENFKNAEISRIEVEKTGDALRVIVHAARPGVLIGKKGQEMDVIRKHLSDMLSRSTVEISVQEVSLPDMDAQLIAESIAEQLVKRVGHKKAMKKAAAGALRAGAKGVKIRIAGRIEGNEIARDEWLRIGSTPLHTLRADIRYGFAEARTTYGILGVKTWICVGEYKSAKE